MGIAVALLFGLAWLSDNYNTRPRLVGGIVVLILLIIILWPER
jgi:hypothetical protein